MNDKMTVRLIAGYCIEPALWKIILDLSRELQDRESKIWKVLTPDTIIIEGENFHFVEDAKALEKEFCPPEGTENLDEAGVVWSLGALVCYASSGHYIFGGRGGIYQRDNPKVELPILRKEHSRLTPIVQRCLCYSPLQRIHLKELHSQAVIGLESCLRTERTKIEISSNDTNAIYGISDDIWPEKMG